MRRNPPKRNLKVVLIDSSPYPFGWNSKKLICQTFFSNSFNSTSELENIKSELFWKELEPGADLARGGWAQAPAIATRSMEPLLSPLQFSTMKA